MINPKQLREDPDTLAQSLKDRGCAPDLFNTFKTLDDKWRKKQLALETMQAERNRLIPKGKPSPEQRTALSELSAKLKELQTEVVAIKDTLHDHALTIPNIVQADTPQGTSENDNVVVRTQGTPPTFSFTPKPHDVLAKDLGLIDFERATKIAGSRFAIFTGIGARLERAVAAFMLDTHANQFGYTEISPPAIVNTQSLQGTGQLPKFKDDQYELGNDYWLSPTAEVQLTNIHYDEILNEQQLPLKYCAFTPCFRKEAGSYGKDMKGLIRLHQFNKVELVQLATPETSNDQLMALLSHAEFILTALELPYRVVELCRGDIGFSSSKTFDLEVWLPSQNQYREISSCSNCLDFQARRSKIRYKDAENTTRYVHTLNGSGLAVGRTIAAIIENYQTNSGILKIPQVLQPYIGLEAISHECKYD
ncbi:MAG: serine--tRNA ligase [Candidatus Marinamargulisbacteria bacterium]